MNIKFDTHVQQIKYRVLLEVAKDYWEGTLEEKKRQIPKIISPGPKSSVRCCIYKEREIVRDRIDLALGGDPANPNIIEVIEAACDSCPFSGIEVTDLCRGCLAHRCSGACHRNAISFGPDLRAHIDKSLCVNCGLCAKACPFQAITNRKRPCEAACKVNAIHPREDGISEIDESKCTRCGQCSAACPFGAIMDKSFITKAIDILKGKENSYLICAPAISSQFDWATLPQVIQGAKVLGFTDVIEAAVGADLVAMNEAHDLIEEGFCTSSCCPAFVRYVQQAFPTLAGNVSNNLSPMAAIGKYIKQTDPTAKCVFVGPCIAKKMEIEDPIVAQYIDCVITFEELAVLFDVRNIDLKTLPESPMDNASYFGRIFARSGGVSDAVREALKEMGSDFEVKPVVASGLDQCKIALTQAKNGKLPGNFIEGMACPGGCIGGPCCLLHEVRDAAQVDKYGHESKETTISGAIASIMADPKVATKVEKDEE
ncbi:MAG: 4Fe-4S dicluster domain-containing protein [Candidatus Enteromonas sp.]|nr:4Fe-4S dicluster domain-containing protein [Candidatus Enteromonas sp.]